MFLSSSVQMMLREAMPSTRSVPPSTRVSSRSTTGSGLAGSRSETSTVPTSVMCLGPHAPCRYSAQDSESSWTYVGSWALVLDVEAGLVLVVVWAQNR